MKKLRAHNLNLQSEQAGLGNGVGQTERSTWAAC